MPAPGPGTVRLAIIRNGIELFGSDYTRDELFPVIRAARIRIRPPERTAISTQLVRGYKAIRGRPDTNMIESPIYREYAQSVGLMTIYVDVPKKCAEDFSKVLAAIGYWGQASSFACCTRITNAPPPSGGFAIPLKRINAEHSIRELFSCFVSDFRDQDVDWKEVMPILKSRGRCPLRLELYVWPMIFRERRSGGKVLVRCSL
jgi:hypothetical protein